MHSVLLTVIRHAGSADEAEAKLETQMTPFWEELEVPEYTRWSDDEEIGRAVTYFRDNPQHCDGKGGPSKPFDEYVGEGNLEAWHQWMAQAIGAYTGDGPDAGRYDAENDRYGVECSYNEQGKWDWFEVGGRWNGAFVLKQSVKSGARLGAPGTGGADPTMNYEGRADLARKGDIDFALMRTLAEQAADIRYDAYLKAVGDLPVPEKTFMQMETEARLEYGRLPHDQEDILYAFSSFRLDLTLEERRELWEQPNKIARERYTSDPWVKAVMGSESLGIGWGLGHVETFGVSREVFVHRAGRSIITAASTLVDGRWREPVDRITFSYTPEEEAAWSTHLWQIIDSLPDDAWLCTVDYHH